MQRQSAKSITLTLFAVLSLTAGMVWAQAPKTVMAFKADAPERYTVVKGDTLWGIAERFTDSPWRWPELWNLNRDQIKNPHRIYPGDVVMLDRSRGRLALDNTVKLSPRVRAESTAKDSVPSVPAHIIEPFLSRPLVVEHDGLDGAASIVAAEGGRVVLGNGGVAYARGMSDAKAASTWLIYRRGEPLVDPETRLTLGYEAIYLGTALVTRAGDPAKIELTSVTQEVGIGDRLLPASELRVIDYAPHAPSTPMNGRVMSIYGGLAKVGEAGKHSIVTLNRGKADGVSVGHVLALYHDGIQVADGTGTRGSTITVPGDRYGLVFVFRVFDRVSYALVMQASDPVRARDFVRTP